MLLRYKDGQENLRRDGLNKKTGRPIVTKAARLNESLSGVRAMTRSCSRSRSRGWRTRTNCATPHLRRTTGRPLKRIGRRRSTTRRLLKRIGRHQSMTHRPNRNGRQRTTGLGRSNCVKVRSTTAPNRWAKNTTGRIDGPPRNYRSNLPVADPRNGLSSAA